MFWSLSTENQFGFVCMDVHIHTALCVFLSCAYVLVGVLEVSRYLQLCRADVNPYIYSSSSKIT